VEPKETFKINLLKNTTKLQLSWYQLRLLWQLSVATMAICHIYIYIYICHDNQTTTSDLIKFTINTSLGYHGNHIPSYHNNQTR
jgi:hypothetical protein